jgi:hypothetical protein
MPPGGHDQAEPGDKKAYRVQPGTEVSMNIYLKCLISFALAGLCFYVGRGLAGDPDQRGITYFVYAVGLVNVYIGVKDLAVIFKSKK